MTEQRAAVIEIIERRKKPAEDSIGASIVVPNEVRINGQHIAMPGGHPVIVHDLSRDDAVQVTLTVFARRIFVGHEDIDEAVTDAVAAAQKRLMDAHRNAMDAQLRAAEQVESAQRALAAAQQALSTAAGETPTVVERLENLGLIDPPADGKAEVTA